MKKQFVTFALAVSMVSCTGPGKQTHTEVDPPGVYAGLSDDHVYEKFIGYHIIRRGASESYFEYRNQRIESSHYFVPNLNAVRGTQDYEENEFFFKENPDARLQLEIMKKYGIRAVFSYNFNEESKRLEISDSLGYGFSKYELAFVLSDSISLSCINFDFREYVQILGSKDYHVERLDSNWVVLKRL